jgi:hypothetical protein
MIIIMSHIITVPELTYKVITFDGQTQELLPYNFYNNIQNDTFLENIQCFYRYLWRKSTKGQRTYHHEQSPCLIVKDIVPKDDFNKWHLYSFHQTLLESPYYRQDCCMITYNNTAEPIRKNWVLFDRNMELLLPVQKENELVHSRISNATGLLLGIGNLPHLRN